MLSLELIDKTEEGRQFHLRDNRRELIGRAATLLTFNDAHLSRRHALLRPHDGHWCIRDLGSTHGTFLNGCRIGRSTPLRAGDRIRVGCTEFHVRVAALDMPSPAPATPPVWPEDIDADEPMTEQADSSPDVLLDDENGSRTHDADGPIPKARNTKRFACRRLFISTGKVLGFVAKWWHADNEKMPSLNVVEEHPPSTLAQEQCHIPMDPSPTQDANNHGDPLPIVRDARQETDEKDRDDLGAACDYPAPVNQDTVCVNAKSGVKDQGPFTGDSDGQSLYWQLALWGWDEAPPADALESDSLHDSAISLDGPTVANGVVEVNLFTQDTGSEWPPFMPVTDPQDTEADVRPVSFESIQLDIPKRLPDVVINFRSLSPGSAAMTRPSRCAKKANTDLSKPNRPALRRQTVLAASGFLLH